MRISYESPIGKAILGKTIGETVEFESPAGPVKVKILEILQ
jgi:transcription elongation factor GreA